MNIKRNPQHQTGLSLIEVLVGIFIFAVGIAALMALQGAITRGQAAAAARTEAVNIAEGILEAARGFGDGTGVPVYADITQYADTVQRGNIDYTVDVSVLDFHWDGDSFECSSTSGASATNRNDTDPRCIDFEIGSSESDFKLMEVTVSWTGARENRFQITENVETVPLGGSVFLTGVISSLPSSAGALTAVDDESSEIPLPGVVYTPGDAPDILRLQLDADGKRFKESSSALPEVTKKDGVTETRWDVITYSLVNSGATTGEFVRREEFASVSCSCNFAGNGQGRRPVVWAGDEYAGGHFVSKETGTSNTSGLLCERCCRDHHDGGSSSAEDSADTASNEFAPFRPNSEFTSGAHKHYDAGFDSGAAVTSGDYLEACRLVRVDGFWRVAQDLRQEERFVLPIDWVRQDGAAATYSAYVTDAVEAYVADATGNYEKNPPCLGEEECASPAWPVPVRPAYPAAADTTAFPAWWSFNFPGGSELLLQSRQVMIDYVSDDLRYVIANCLDDAPEDLGDDCKVNGEIGHGDVVLDRTRATNPLELIPFFEAQLTKLHDWSPSDPSSLPMYVSNEDIETNNAHDRGTVTGTDLGWGEITATGYRDNLSFLGTENAYLPDTVHDPVPSIFDVCSDNQSYAPDDATNACD